jgi:MFS family permease
MPGRILVDTTPLRESRDFRLLFIGQLISVIGTQLTVVAIPYQVYSMTHSTLQVGAISLAQLFPFLAGALSAGPVGDAVDKRRMMVWTAAALMLSTSSAHWRPASRASRAPPAWRPCPAWSSGGRSPPPPP